MVDGKGGHETILVVIIMCIKTQPEKARGKRVYVEQYSLKRNLGMSTFRSYSVLLLSSLVLLKRLGQALSLEGKEI